MRDEMKKDEMRDEMRKKAGEIAEGHRLEGYHCSESSLRAAAQVAGIALSEDILRISSVFRGGGGGYGGRCGIAEAGLMLLGYLYGRSDPAAPVDGYSFLAREWLDRFAQAFASLDCRDIRPAAMQASAPARSCSPTYIKGSALLVDMLLDAPALLENMPKPAKA